MLNYIRPYKSFHSVYSENEHVARAQQINSANKCNVYIKSAELISSNQLKLVFDSAHVKCDV